MKPDTFPPWHTVYRWFAPLRDGGVFEAINHHLVIKTVPKLYLLLPAPRWTASFAVGARQPR